MNPSQTSSRPSGLIEMDQRFLRPHHIVASGDAVWLVDAARPAAVVIDPGGSPDLVTWPSEVRGELPEPGRIVARDGQGIVVQDGSELSWVRKDGLLAQQHIDDLTLAAADPEFAWLADTTRLDVGHRDSPGPPVPPPVNPGRVVAVSPDGSRTETTTPQPVRGITIDQESVTVVLSERPIVTPTKFGFRYGYPTRTLRLDRRALLAGRLEELETTGTRPLERGPSIYSPWAWYWLQTDPRIVLRYGIQAGDLVWWAGAPRDVDRIDRQVRVVGHDPTTGEERIRVDLGLGLVSAGNLVGEELWLAVARERALYEPRSQGIEVVAVSTLDGDSRTVLAANSVDISFTAPPLRRPGDEEINDHIRHSIDLFDQLDRYWIREDGDARPLSDGLADPAVNVMGDWPDARLVVTFRHSSRPGVLLRRTYRLFGEWGEPVGDDNAAIFLMEQLDTGYIAPASEAVAGILDT